MRKLSQLRGFTLVTTVVAIGVFSILLLVVYGLSSMVTRVSRANLLRSTAITIAQQQLEMVRNLPFDSIGTATTYPTGPLQDSQTITRNGASFTITLAIEYVDDPADGDALGTIVGKPVDTAPADYKRVDLQVCWDTTTCVKPVRLTTLIAPKNLESIGNSGSLFITVVDASGQPVPIANVTVTNTTTSPNVSIVTTTDTNGKLQLLNLPPALDSYHIVVTKNGYSTDSTLPVSGSNPNPKKRDTSVVLASVTSTTFAIDRVSTLVLRTINQATCNAIGNLSIRIHGERLIGESPDVYAYDQTLTLDANGSLTLPAMAWDHYTVFLTSVAYDVSGVNPPDEIILNPNSVVTADMTLVPSQANTMRVTVRDSGTKAPLASAVVTVTDGGAYNQSLTTDQGYLNQTDWSGGAGQSIMTDTTKYATHAGAQDTTTPGQVSIASVSTDYAVTESFSSTTNRDAALTTADWSTATSALQLLPDPNDGSLFLSSGQGQSEKMNATNGKITTATLTASQQLNGETISYFLAADGVTFEPVTPGVAHPFASPGSDLRWRAILQSINPTVTPTIDDIDIAYTEETRPTTTATITSSTYDLGTVTNFSTLSWEPLTQPVATGLTPVRWQTAANDDGSTWDFVGPDGTDQTYYSSSGSSLHSSQSGHQYFRYKLFLSTSDQFFTPTVTDVRVIRNNSCIPPGQVFFSPLPAANDYSVSVSLPGYEPFSTSVTVNGDTAAFTDLTVSP